jgi:flagellar hook assembly protein FlgD
VIGFLDGIQPDPIVAMGTPTTLDVGGLTRIRNLPTQGNNDCLVIGASLPGSGADNFLKRLDFTGDNTEVLSGDGTWVNVSSGADLDWESDGTDVWTGHGLNGFPAGDVFIGSVPYMSNAKLSIFENVSNTTNRSGQSIFLNRFALALGTTRALNVALFDNEGSGSNVGVESLVRGGKLAIGGRFRADLADTQSEWSAGAAGYALGAIDQLVDVIGLYGYAEKFSTGSVSKPIGVYGEAIFTGSTPISSIAGHFQGTVQQLLASITLSDQTLKQNIQSIENAGDILSSLNPVKYNYNMEEAFGISTGDEIAHGFLAQEVQEVFPDAVADFYVPQRRDTAGVVTRERSLHLGLKYNEFIPLLVKGHQEQEGTIVAQAAMLAGQASANETLQNQVAALTEQVTNQASMIAAMQESLSSALTAIQLAKSDMDSCCQNKATGSLKPASDGMQLQQNVPNPFENTTRIDFILPEAAQVRLEISDSQGRSLETLINSQMAAGSHSTTWDGSRHSPGMYYYSLYANGELLTKKMIKR